MMSMSDADGIRTDGNEVLFEPRATVVTDAIIGKRQGFARLGLWEWSFLLISVVNISVCIGLSIARLVTVLTIPEEKDSPDFTLTILLIINSAFCLFYVIHGLLKELRYEVWVLIVATVVVLFYCIIEYSINRQKRTVLKEARLIVACLVAPVNVALAYKVAYDFGWLEFRILGASEARLKMYRQATFFLSLIKFDLQVAVSFMVLILRNGVDLKANRTEVILVLAIGISVSLVWYILGRILVIHESKVCAWIFTAISLAAPAFVFYKVIKAYVKLMRYGVARGADEMLLYSTLVIAALLILVRGVVYVELFGVFRNFGKGLRQIAFDNSVNERTGLLASR